MKRLLFCLLISFASTPAITQSMPDTLWQTTYRESFPKINDLVHTKIDARFDFAKAHMNGKVWLTLKPHLYPTDSLQLDAKGMDIAKVMMLKGSTMTPLQFKYDGWIMKIKLDRSYKRTESYTVFIEYTAKPNEVKAQGSEAITEAKGLYFINPTGTEKDKPTQIWTQGETEGTSVWCPIIDKPNQKTTDEIIMTVPDKFVTLSNGRLASQKKNADGTRTDTWKMDLPHSPYLFFMGAGDFAVVKDHYKGKEVNYYVEKEYASTARKIFGLTPEMIGYFEKITGVPYPWVKYSQIVGRDYVSGAMENTTATLHQESAQQDARELIDGNGWESVISHELFHQWFGDYVTCESWSNLTVNESFADYGQYLWKEYKYGADVAGEENYSEMRAYLGTPSEAEKHLVRFYYEDKENMFDLVSYQKGGRVLNMLRNHLGDSAFFKGLNLYLNTNKFKNGEAHQLRLALEEVSGLDLNWFFNQWYFGYGHPKVTINYAYDDALKQVHVTIKQTQGLDHLFKIPIAIDVYNGASKVRHKVWIDRAEQTFTFNYTSKPDLVNVDAEKFTVWDKTDNKTLDNFIHQYKYAANYVDRREAVVAALRQIPNPQALDLVKTALKDKFYGVRSLTMDRLDMRSEPLKAAIEPVLVELAKTDKKSTVKAKAIELLGVYKKPEYKEIFTAHLNDSSYSISGAALGALSEIDSAAGLTEARKLKGQKTKGGLSESVSNILIRFSTEEDFDFISDNFAAMPVTEAKFQACGGFAEFLGKVKTIDHLKKGVDLIVTFREAIPKAYRNQTDPPINAMLNDLMEKKSTAGLHDQADYIKSKLP